MEAMHTAAELVRVEAEALLRLAERLEGPMAKPFEQALQLVMALGEHGRVVVSGMGKSGLIAQKIAATLSSTGTPALFLHPADAAHGDLGVMTAGDLLLVLSASGETEEILRMLAVLRRLPAHQATAVISFCCQPQSAVARASTVVLDCSVEGEACGLNLAPTSSTTAMLALGDALSIAASTRKGFQAEDFARLHPGGRLGRQLAPVRALMHAGASVPRVTVATPMREVIYEMSRKGLGMTVVEDDEGQLAGVLSDGDLRRLLEKQGGHAMEMTAGEAMHPGAWTVGADELAARALAILEEHKVTSLVVVDEHPQRAAGVIHLHDLWGTQLI